MVIELFPHPTSPAGPVARMTVTLARRGRSLGLRFTVQGRPDEVTWPEPRAPGRADDLWRHTCFEAFVQSHDGYVEFNLSPTGQWASYRFDGPRMGMRNAAQRATPPQMHRTVDQASLDARLELPDDVRRLGLSAVIEATDGSFSWWALAHPSDKPDFHHPDSFVLELP